MTPRAVLLVPHPDHAEALLADGPCGARVPVAYLDYARRHHPEPTWMDEPRGIPRTDGYGCCLGCGSWTPYGHPETHEHEEGCAEVARCANLPRALVLAWDGLAAEAGCDRAARSLPVHVHGDQIALDYTLADALDLAARCERAGLGTVVTIGGAP